MVTRNLTDQQIGELLGASSSTVNKFRQTHGIPAARSRGGKGNASWGWGARKTEPVMPPGEITTYTDEHGRKITKYPSGYAVGVEAGPTAKGNSRY